MPEFDLSSFFSGLFGGGSATPDTPPPAPDSIAKMFSVSADQGASWNYKPATWVDGPMGLTPQFQSDVEAAQPAAAPAQAPSPSPAPVQRVDQGIVPPQAANAPPPVGSTEYWNSTRVQPTSLADEVQSVQRPKLVGVTSQGQFSLDGRFNDPSVNGSLRDKMGQLQGLLQTQLGINSVYRDPDKNAAVGGARGSMHMSGRAADINVKDWSIEDRINLIQKASALGFTGIGVYDNAIHLDIGNRRSWGPDHSSGSVPKWARGAINTHLSNGYEGSLAKSPPPNAVQIINSNATAYSPRLGGDKMEGGYESSQKGPDGLREVRTLSDFASGRSNYITLAGDPSHYGKEYTIPKVSWMDKSGKLRTAFNVPAVVHDTGSAFKGQPEGRFDIPIDKDASDEMMARSAGLWKKDGLQFIRRK